MSLGFARRPFSIKKHTKRQDFQKTRQERKVFINSKRLRPAKVGPLILGVASLFEVRRARHASAFSEGHVAKKRFVCFVSFVFVDFKLPQTVMRKRLMTDCKSLAVAV